MRYGTELGVPWGVSESAYNARDLEFTYQYSNFGVPGLGLGSPCGPVAPGLGDAGPHEARAEDGDADALDTGRVHASGSRADLSGSLPIIG